MNFMSTDPKNIEELLDEDISVLNNFVSLEVPQEKERKPRSQKFTCLSLSRKTGISGSGQQTNGTQAKLPLSTNSSLPLSERQNTFNKQSPKRRKFDDSLNLSPIKHEKGSETSKTSVSKENVLKINCTKEENKNEASCNKLNTNNTLGRESAEFDALESYFGLTKRKSDCKSKLSQLSQFFLNSQVMEQINTIVSQENTEFKVPQPVHPLKSEISFDETCREEFEKFFEHVKNSISALGTTTANFQMQDQKVLKVIDIVCQTSPDETAGILEQTKSNIPSTQSLADIDWPVENQNSLLTSTNVSVSNASFGTAVRQAWLANANKSLVPLKNINSTIITQNKIDFKSMGPFYDLPMKVKELIRLYRGIESLYDWQDECLNLPAIKERKNLIYALPTSGGKTLVAEILMLRELLCYKQNALFILPYVAIVQEKVWTLSPFAVDLDFLVEEYAASKGTYPPRKRRRKKSIYIATIEKALGLINSLIETERLNELGLIVVDELHLVGEQGRGSTLEGLLTKVMYINAGIHVVGMSATIGNVDELCKFLGAEVYMQNFRPVELIEYVKCGSEIAKVNWSSKEEELLTVVRKTDFDYPETLNAIDPDRLGGLVMEVIPEGSCLIFCPSKKNCENVAHLLCKIADRKLLQHRAEEKQQVKNALKDECGALCKTFKISIQYGIAYHHSGLTNDERRVIEDAFRAGIISVICCTSTLAAGVNLPAKRVILRQPYVGKDFISLSKYKQMVGRAGRAGLGETGDSILICTTQDLPKVRKLLVSPMDEALSSMHEFDGKGLRHLLLSFISLGLANTRLQLQEVTKSTLFVLQSERFNVDAKKLTDRAISDLFKLGALQEADLEASVGADVSVRMDTSTTSLFPLSDVSNTIVKRKITINNHTKLIISKLGAAAIRGNFELSRAHLLYDDLYQAQKSLVLLNVLHLLYLVTPYDIAEQIYPNKQVYYNIFCKLGTKELHTANVLGLNDSVALKFLSNKKIKSLSERVINRFYLALILYDLWNEKTVFDVSEKYQIDRGIVQNLMTGSATFASNVVNFCEGLEEFWTFAHLIKGMSQRLSHCCVKELLPLMELPSVKLSRAKQLYNSGFKTIQSIAKASTDALVDNIEFLSRTVAKQLIAAAKMLLLEKVENLREDAEDVLDGVEDPRQMNQSLVYNM